MWHQGNLGLFQLRDSRQRLQDTSLAGQAKLTEDQLPIRAVPN